MSILVVSVSHKSTSVSHLAQLALDAAASAKLAEQLVGSEHIDEAVVLVHLQPHRVVCIGYAVSTALWTMRRRPLLTSPV